MMQESFFWLSKNFGDKISSISNPESVKESYFGSSVSMDDEYLIIGNYNGEKSRIYQIHNDSVELKQTLYGPDGNQDGKFGRSVDINNGQILIGATYSEKAYIFKLNSNQWNVFNSISSDSRSNSIFGKKIPCKNGKSSDYGCKSIDMLSFISPKDLTGGVNTELNDLWGWTDASTGKEYGLIGLRNGTSFVDISDPLNVK